MSTIELRNIILQNLKNQKEFQNMVTANSNGSNLSFADIALPDKNGDPEVYRIAVIKHASKTI